MATAVDSVKLMNECIRKVKQLEHQQSEQLDDTTKQLLLADVDNSSLLTPPNTDPDSPASDIQSKDFGDFIDEPLGDDLLTAPPSSASSVSSSNSSSRRASVSSQTTTLISIGCVTRSRLSEHHLFEKTSSTNIANSSIACNISSLNTKSGALTVTSLSTTSSVSLTGYSLLNARAIKPKHSLAEQLGFQSSPFSKQQGSCASSVNGSSSVCSQEEESCSTLGVSFVCKWKNCDWPGGSDDLVDHIREIHVDLQPYAYHEKQQLPPSSFRNVLRGAGSSTTMLDASGQPTHSNYVCLWQGCKVYGKGSLCKSWLENHVLQHSGPRPFKCIFDRCGQRFKTRLLLEKHVNTHFNGCGHCDFCRSMVGASRNQLLTGNGDLSGCITSLGGSSSTSGPGCLNSLRSRSAGGFNGTNGQLTPAKQNKKKKNAKLRRRPYARSTDDLFDECTMQKLRRSLFHFNSMTGLDATPDQRQVTFHGKIVARCREEETGKMKVLLHWEPEEILDDVWVNETEASKLLIKKVPLALLPLEAVNKIYDLFFVRESRVQGKQRRK